MTHLATTHRLPEELINTAEDGWYDPNTLRKSQRYPYIKPVVRMTTQLAGPERNFVLTSRLPDLREITINSIERELPFFTKDNILIREKDSDLSESAFKASRVYEQAAQAPWVVLFEDSTKYVRRVLDQGPENCLVVNIPLGHIKPDLVHERLFVVGRYPYEHQGMYPLFQLMKRALKEGKIG